MLAIHLFSFTLYRPAVGEALANRNRRLVYGGGFSGLMGAVSDACLGHGGMVIGITPRAIFEAGGEGSKPSLLPHSETSSAGQVRFQLLLMLKQNGNLLPFERLKR